MTIEHFKNLFKQGNKVITGGIINLINGLDEFATIEFDDISINKERINFSYVDRRHEMAGWQGERAPFFGLKLNQIEKVTQMPDAEKLLGDFYIRVRLQSMTVDLYFDVVEGTDIKKYGLLTSIELLDSSAKRFEKRVMTHLDNVNEIINAIHSHTGTFLLNVNAGDFIQSKGFETYNQVFSNVKHLRQNELLSFDNSTMQPIRFTDKNVPVYSMDFSTNFYLEIKNIVSAEEIDAEEYADVFDIPTTRIFNLHMEDKTIITVGLMDD